ncbi:coenzyme F420-0:L-glutamate ligase [Patulibacter brassicae]|uniref:Coenzyme F420-0:L-glutamate ligase n=1 Tax=Patulibacter brassicae TaxID=1705717 RepID=A0ABU4VPL2_9ACTN|nr:coenzyme F420-0:L-glutamate ligase [Patulibacter brassicae]MDX8152793.1 coenzyme F420-0:L-glutamate ligase [Patulibacter brassicae]
MSGADLTVRALPPLPEVRPGDDLAALLTAAHPAPFPDDAVLVVSHKVVSKAEGAVVRLADVVPSPRARELARELDKDPAVVEVVLGQTREVVRARRGVLICRTHHGFVAAHAGVDGSNVAAGSVVTLPVDPDASARRLRDALPGRPAVVIADSFGRPWRHGQAEVAIGCAGLVALDDRRGQADREGRELLATQIAIADHVAGAADLARLKDDGRPAVLVTGLARWRTDEHGPGAATLRRAADEDLFGAA